MRRFVGLKNWQSDFTGVFMLLSSRYLCIILTSYSFGNEISSFRIRATANIGPASGEVDEQWEDSNLPTSGPDSTI